ncbi:hypothetical protein RSAG8_00394, partial [Rhizoctonia solani AG-8 WAC10335]
MSQSRRDSLYCQTKVQTQASLACRTRKATELCQGGWRPCPQ